MPATLGSAIAEKSRKSGRGVACPMFASPTEPYNLNFNLDLTP